jgi:AcrR family transcriptional regulator
MGTADRRAREKKERRQAILDCAKRLFARKGFENATINEVAQEAEFAKGTIYLYFKSKEEILYILLEPWLEENLRQVIELAAKPSPSQETTLRRVFTLMYKKYLEEPEKHQIILNYNAKKYKRMLTKENFFRLRKIMRDNLHEIEKIVARGLELGEFHSVNPKSCSILIWNMFMGAVLYDENRTYDGKRSYLESTLDEAINLMVRGLKK